MRMLVACAGLLLAAGADAQADVADNKQVVSRFFEEVLQNGNVEVMEETHAEAVVVDSPGRGADRASNQAANARFHEVMGDVTATIDEMIGEGDVVMGRYTINATYLGGLEGVPETSIGNRITYDGYFRFRLEDGRIVENFWLRNEPAYEIGMGLRPAQ